MNTNVKLILQQDVRNSIAGILNMLLQFPKKWYRNGVDLCSATAQMFGGLSWTILSTASEPWPPDMRHAAHAGMRSLTFAVLPSPSRLQWRLCTCTRPPCPTWSACQALASRVQEKRAVYWITWPHPSDESVGSFSSKSHGTSDREGFSKTIVDVHTEPGVKLLETCTFLKLHASG